MELDDLRFLFQPFQRFSFNYSPLFFFIVYTCHVRPVVGWHFNENFVQNLNSNILSHGETLRIELYNCNCMIYIRNNSKITIFKQRLKIHRPISGRRFISLHYQLPKPTDQRKREQQSFDEYPTTDPFNRGGRRETNFRKNWPIHLHLGKNEETTQRILD